MSKPKFLRNRVTGVVFPYNDHLAKRNKNMEPCNGKGAEPVFDTVDADIAKGKASAMKVDPSQINIGDDPGGSGAAGDGSDTGAGAGDGGPAGGGGDNPLMVGEVPLDEATKEQLIEFAQAAFGKALAKQMKVDNMREEVRKLMTEG